MKLNFIEVKQRMNDLVSYLSSSLSDPNGHFNTLKSRCQNMVPEEKLFYIFLATHFDSLDSAEEFYRTLNWNHVKQSDESEIRNICKEFFKHRRVVIGDHRRYFGCLNTERKVEYTLEILGSYKKVIKKYGTQYHFFEIDGKPEFNTLYQRMTEIEHFHTRLPRFDHLERISRTHNSYTVPKRFYAEDATGPLDGLTYLFLGERYRKNKANLKKFLTESFPVEWNAKVDAKYRIPLRVTFDRVIQALEQWTIFHAKQLLPPKQQNNPIYVFDLESCLCNWQKWK